MAFQAWYENLVEGEPGVPVPSQRYSTGDCEMNAYWMEVFLFAISSARQSVGHYEGQVVSQPVFGASVSNFDTQQDCGLVWIMSSELSRIEFLILKNPVFGIV